MTARNPCLAWVTIMGASAAGFRQFRATSRSLLNRLAFFARMPDVKMIHVEVTSFDDPTWEPHVWRWERLEPQTGSKVRK